MTDGYLKTIFYFENKKRPKISLKWINSKQIQNHWFEILGIGLWYLFVQTDWKNLEGAIWFMFGSSRMNRHSFVCSFSFTLCENVNRSIESIKIIILLIPFFSQNFCMELKCIENILESVESLLVVICKTTTSHQCKIGTDFPTVSSNKATKTLYNGGYGLSVRSQSQI